VQPTGPGPVVEPKDRGVFPPEFEAKYQAVKKLADDYMYGSINTVNEADPRGDNMQALGKNLIEWAWANTGLGNQVLNGINELQKEAIRLGLTTVGGK
jgi:hypothetical protein